jgi:hypothetical protein
MHHHSVQEYNNYISIFIWLYERWKGHYTHETLNRVGSSYRGIPVEWGCIIFILDKL